jgi:hypothetical protein
MHTTRTPACECQRLPTTRPLITDKAMSDRVLLCKTLLRQSALHAKQENCVRVNEGLIALTA